MSKASNLAGFVTSISPPSDLNVGIVTATSFVGDGAQLTGVGIGTDGSINTTGIITDPKTLVNDQDHPDWPVAPA